MLNVISFCVYGSRATYVLGMRENIILGKKFYPGWEIRIYYNSTVPEKYISEYNKLGAKCIKCENLGKNKMNWEGMVWRFLPLDDSRVHYWISRDADSRLSKREAYTVAQWMRSGKTLHCIRDHRCHYHAIMGGLFGINNQSFHKKYRFKKISAIISDLYGYYRERPYNVDQEFLNNQLWKLLKNDSLAHISNGGRRIYASDIAIPSVANFIGKQYRIADTPSIDNDSDSDSSNKINMINKQFKIKSVYNNYCLDIENEKVKLKIISDECTSQQWKMDDKHRIIHCDTNKFLDFDNSKDLIISTNGKNTWSIREGGFIQNNSNNMAIDIKGGLKDKRREAWLYKINYSEAQQWDLQNGSKNEISEDCNEIKNYNEINYDNIFPITTSIPSEVFVTDIDDIIKNKKVDIYDGIKNRPVGARYEFNTEKEYYNAYKEAKWGFTKKKNGWDCLRHYEIVANGCLPLFENLENCPETVLDSFPKKILLEAKNKKNTMSDKEYNYYLKTIFNYFKENFTCEIVAERFLKKIHRDNKKKLSEVKILLLHGNECNNYMADMLFIGLRRLLNENIVDEKKLVQLYKSFSGNAYGKGFTYTKKLSDELMIDRNNIEEKIKNKFYDYVIYRKCGGDEGELGDCRKKMEYWDLVKKKYSPNEIVFLYGGDRMVNEGQESYLLNHLRYHSHKGLCFVREFTATETSNYKNFINNPYINEQSKTILVLNHNFHHKNKKGLEIICDYLGYNLVYGTEQDIPDADVIYCPSRPFNAGKYPNKRFVFGPHLSIFPDNKLRSIQNKNNSIYIQPSPWARDVWINWKSMDTESLIPVKSFPFPVEVDLFKPEPNAVKENIFVMFKHRNPKELKFIENYLNNNKVSYKTFRYGGYKQDDYIKYLKTCKYGIWIGRHESQGFALEESLSCNVPLLVWNVSNMRQQHGWNGCPDVYGITIPFWDKTCGEYFYKEEEFEETYNKFLKNLDSYNPREFILNTVSVEQCAENFKKLFLNNDEKDTDDIIFMTLTNDGYLDYTLNCIESLKMCNSKYQLNCYCIGDECVQRLSNNNIKTIKINNNDNFSFESYGGKNWSNIVIEKIKSIHDNLYKYKYVCYTDGDIVFLNDKFMDYCIENIGESDMICQNDCDKYGCDCIRWICSGFMFIKSTETTRNFFNLKNIQLNNKWRDQKWINANKQKIKYKLLPKDLFPNGGYYYKNIDKISDPYMIHFNFVVGHEKKNRMKKYNKWFLNS
jgi:hypothetical protein